MPKLSMIAFGAALAAGAALAGEVVVPSDGVWTAYSMVTRDGRRLVSRGTGNAKKWELVPTNSLPANLPSVRQWTIYGIKSAHSDLGLHRSNYVQRKGTVLRMDKARELIAADRRPDSDPAAFRWVVEGWWSFLNYPADRGEPAARPFVEELRRRDRFDVGGNWCGSTTHVMGYEELCRSLYAKREMEEKWGVFTKTAQIVDNPGVSSALIGLYADIGIRYLTHWPNHYTMGLGGKTLYAHAMTGDRPCVFWWEAPDCKSRVLVWTGSSSYCGSAFGVNTAFIDPPSHPFPDKAVKPGTDWKPDMARWERKTAILLEAFEKSVPYDVWLFPNYHDDEMPSTRLADAFAAWNEKWATPVFRTVGSLDEPFERLERKWGDKIPVMRGDLSCAWDRATPAFAELLARKLAADRRLPIAEAKAAIASATAGVPFPKDDFDHAYEALQLNDDHSYGFSGYTGRRVYDTWAQHIDWIETAERASKLQNSKTPSSESNINPVNPVKNGVTENQWYRIAVTNGVIYSIFDKELKRELLSAPANTFHYTRDRYKTWSDASALRASRFSSTVTLASDRKAILIENVIENAKDLLNNDRFKRYGHYAFPFSIENPKFSSQLNGPVIDAFAGVLPQVANSYSCIRDWCAVEGETYGIALIQPDTFVMEFGKQHGMNAYGRESRPASSAMWSLVFGDGLQWHLSEAPSFRFRYVITSYAGDWKSAHIPAFAAREVGALAADKEIARHVSCDAANVELVALKAADDGKGYVARFRETEGRAVQTRIRQDLVRGAKYVLADLLERGRSPLPDGEFKIAPFAFATIRIEREGLNVAFAPASERWTGLIVRPRAFAGGIPGQMYLLWGAEEGIDTYELYRDGKMIATVHREADDGIPLMNVRYEECGLEPGRKYEYRLRPVFRNGHRGELGTPFYGLTRAMSEETQNGIVCENAAGRIYVRYDGATLTSWSPVALGGSDDVFFMPKNTPWGKEVHGGVPICWPWVGRREGMPKHGLVRYMKWRLVKRIGKGGIELETCSTPETLKVWPHPFKLVAVISIAGTDGVEIAVTETNTGDAPYESALGFHPYFSMADARSVALDGKSLPKPWVMQEFAADGKSHRLVDLKRKRSISVKASGNDTWYVWNPGTERTPLCETLAPDEWQRFYCLEPVMKKSLPLSPGKSRTHKFKVMVGK